MTRQQEQIANHSYVVRRSSVNNGLPYRQQQLYEADTEEYEDVWPPKTPKSAIRYTTTQAAPPVVRSGKRQYVIQTSPPPQTKRATKSQEEDEQPRPRRKRGLLIFSMGVGMATMLTLWVLGNMFISWVQVTQDDIHYGRPRTFQVDMVVGHNNDNSRYPTHFVAINYRSRIEIIELPAGDSSKAKIYSVPIYGQNVDLAVVKLSFRDLNGDNKLDMVIIVGETVHIAYINDGGQFRPLKPGERVSQY